ncbi:hypothetical protein CH63R_09667 [Colletotrichum higginsianum IMI 349063]|uniref:Uncharacterized protein n=1 Tax=Colletotrichum higginsianum (strain IMI 349063) TaxID=759273 RepID=A0A1B7Y7X9_COLHI|nr:hypothetical protein CH63R_09667 [Colletotrichum higginsianum IMI 349063]OBR08146.1 hypothetical protein CH63R_09667 [Colletotrichum higginsianum IMI 349063]
MDEPQKEMTEKKVAPPTNQRQNDGTVLPDIPVDALKEPFPDYVARKRCALENGHPWPLPDPTRLLSPATAPESSKPSSAAWSIVGLCIVCVIVANAVFCLVHTSGRGSWCLPT